jgi:hypothetical protein
MFQPTVTEAGLREALLGVEGRVVSGPTALGVYVVQLPAEPADEAAVDAAIDALRGRTEVIRFVEREP